MPKQTLFQRLKSNIAELRFYEALSLAISLISMLSLGFIWYQIRQTSMSLQASAFATIGNYTMDLDKMFITEPKLRKYFYDKETIAKGDEDYDKVMAIAEFQLDLFDATMTQLDIKAERGLYRK